MMTRRTALRLGAAVAAPAILRGARRVAGDKPNLLFIWTDQQRADTMAAYGNTRFRVPMMNRLASQSVVFDRAYITQPVCTPSRSSIMTGVWPHQNGCVRNNIRLSSTVQTMPELLDDSAYHTGYMGKWHLGDEVFPQRGFQKWAAIEDGIYEQYYGPGRDRGARSAYHGFLANLGYKPNGKNIFSRGFATTLPVEHSKPSFLAQEASKFILRHRADPWMLYVNFLEPHTPFSSALDDLHSEAEAPLARNYPGVPAGDREPVWYQRRRAGFREKFEKFDLRSPAGWQRVSRNYAGLCSLVDQAVGRILWSLEASGQMDNTVIVYTSDHGEMMGAHSLLTKQVMYEEAMRVPFLLRVPFRGQKPRRVAQPVSHIDTVPTLLELLGKKNAGESLVSLLEGRRRREDHVFLEWTAEGEDQGPNARTVVSPGGYKLVLHDTDRSMLFDHNKDPLEMHNLYESGEHAPVRDRLRKKIEQWQAATRDTMRLPGAK